MSDYSDLDGFNDEYVPENHGFTPGLDQLPDGPYEFTVVRAEVGWSKRATQNGDRVIRVELSVSNGMAVEHVYWLNRQKEVNQFGHDCGVLGLDSKSWGKPSAPLSKALPAACLALRGRRFRGFKSSNKGKQGDKVFHNLAVNVRLPDAKPGELAAAAAAESSDEAPY